jgi:hypothetical protein
MYLVCSCIKHIQYNGRQFWHLLHFPRLSQSGNSLEPSLGRNTSQSTGQTSGNPLKPRNKPSWVGNRNKPSWLGNRSRPSWLDNRSRPSWLDNKNKLGRRRPSWLGNRSRPSWLGNKNKPSWLDNRSYPSWLGNRNKLSRSDSHPRYEYFHRI